MGLVWAKAPEAESINPRNTTQNKDVLFMTDSSLGKIGGLATASQRIISLQKTPGAAGKTRKAQDARAQGAKKNFRPNDRRLATAGFYPPRA
jgi:hypothetical protein